MSAVLYVALHLAPWVALVVAGCWLAARMESSPTVVRVPRSRRQRAEDAVVRAVTGEARIPAQRDRRAGERDG